VYYNKKNIGQERGRDRRKKATCWAVQYFESREKGSEGKWTSVRKTRAGGGKYEGKHLEEDQVLRRKYDRLLKCN
jgi:hypothetical protein